MATIEVETYNLDNPDRPTIAHDPNAVLDYSEDWTAWLAAAGADTIQSATMILETTLASGPVAVAWDANTVTGWVTGGTPGKTHRVTFRITTVGGRTDDRSVFLKVKER